MKFTAVLEGAGKTATGIEVPPEVVDALGSGKKPAVTVTIGAHTYRSTIATMGGRFMLPVSAENRTSAGVSAGDELEVSVELDTALREVTVPADFAAALDNNLTARTTFDGISYSNQRWHILSIEGAKTPETRARRIEKSITILGEGRAR
ncbi:DUF1905 domain-containing protein [Antrihabitans sp. YC3-6]|uniref:DUF1905 domain-containing protein n=1 Tax=Antrihabitans stalagmiti TaxID=2799499 RepID=A0A934U5B0_9NOCA|nr:YdeI/OmpD-associated family protein [Antrihabitans stalagmiti]MBJ8341177.1 DUF1905 domain-containing protein [Antrihabitans stalagmiti]